MKLIVAGSRSWKDEQTVHQCIRQYIDGIDDVTIFCGTAIGPDTFGEQFALDNTIPIKYFEPDWVKFGRGAGYKRNTEMAVEGTDLLAFWDTKSKGTKQMIDEAVYYNLKTTIIVEAPLISVKGGPHSCWNKHHCGVGNCPDNAYDVWLYQAQLSNWSTCNIFYTDTPILEFTVSEVPQ